jgi:hypothetical protein
MPNVSFLETPSPLRDMLSNNNNKLENACRMKQFWCIHSQGLISKKAGVCQQILVKILSVKFRENPSGGSQIVSCRQMDGQTK